MDVRPAPKAPRRAPPRGLRALFAFVIVVVSVGCVEAVPRGPVDPIASLRYWGSRGDQEAVGRWLLGELVAPGGDAEQAKVVRRRLDGMTLTPVGLFPSVARGIDDEAHGRNRSASKAYLRAIVEARSSDHPDAPLIAWYSANRLLGLRSSVSNLWETAGATVKETIKNPGKIGWRARGELVGWWSLDAPRHEAGMKSPIETAAEINGCAKRARLAGPFGHKSPSDGRRRFEAERAGPWPLTFPRDPRQRDAPRVVPVERVGCLLRAAEPVPGGIYYVETFFDLPSDRELIVSVQGALAVFVDDEEVLTRDVRIWGIWPRFGAHLRLPAGRHRVLARVGGSETSVRLLDPSGAPLDVETSDDPAPPYSLQAPEILADPNVLTPFLTALGVPPQRGARPSAPRDTDDPISRYFAAQIAHIEGQQDVSSVLLEPLVADPSRATGPALAAEATFIDEDPIFAQAIGRDLQKDLRARAASKDRELWWPLYWLALDEADKTGVPDVVPKLTALANQFREVPDMWKGLSVIYGRMGWKVERARAVKEAAARFPDDAEALRALYGLYNEQGYVAEADKVAEQIRALDPNAEVELERAIDRRDYAAAIKELSAIGARRADRKDIAIRIADLLTRAGISGESIEKLSAALKKKPDDVAARLALADARLAQGDKNALSKALIDAIQAGADDSAIREAIELLEGTTELSPYRRDGRKIIAEFEKSAAVMPGTAARVLDYSALWVHVDGSARMLEHEIICIQSQEAIQEHAEQRMPRGLVLKLRTIKKDGRILEPEIVEGKPTVTMPHLEEGDYIETESLASLRGDGEGGLVFQGPRWFFREEKLSYWLSEFVVVSPKTRPLQVETGGDVPDPQVTENGGLITRRWRVDKSPAVPEEPASAPIQEFMPNVRVGWGVSLESSLARFVDMFSDETPRDPRLARVARAIASDARPSEPGASAYAPAPEAATKVSRDEQARRIYRWVLANVEAGRESDGRRAVIGKSGNRMEAFAYLCRLIGIDVSFAVVRDRLSPPPVGPFSESETFSGLVVRIATESGPHYMIVRDKYAPFGYLPSALRGQPAVVLKPGAPRETTPTSGSRDGVTHEGTVELAADGSATLTIEQRYEGKIAINLRNVLESLPDARLNDTIESRLLPQALPGARLVALDVKNLAELDAPLILAMKLRMDSFATVRGGELVVSTPFAMRLGGLASLASRETPLYISEQIATRSALRLRVVLPEGARVVTALAPFSAEEDGRSVSVRDRTEAGALIFDRLLDLPAGRVKPEAYASFQAFVRRADAALNRDIIVALGASGSGR